LNERVQLTDLVSTFAAVRATRSRKAKIAAVADCLRQAGEELLLRLDRRTEQRVEEATPFGLRTCA